MASLYATVKEWWGSLNRQEKGAAGLAGAGTILVAIGYNWLIIGARHPNDVGGAPSIRAELGNWKERL